MRYDPHDGIECYVVVPPQFADQVFAYIQGQNGQNLRCVVKMKATPNNTVNERQDGTRELVPFGADRNDLTLHFNSAGEESVMAFEYIKRNNIPVYVYPRAAGSVQLNFPLIRGLGIDPLDTTLTDNYSLSSGTTMYLPRPVASVGERLFPVSDGIPMAPGIVISNGSMSRFPLGMGYASFRPRKNLLKMSNLNTIEHSGMVPPDGWSSDVGGGTWDTDMGQNDNPWCEGAYTWWTTSTATILHSYKFNLPSSTSGIYFSCYLRTDGQVIMRIKDSAGAPIASRTITQCDGKVEVIFTALGSSTIDNCMEFLLSSGSYMEIGCPQLIDPSPGTLEEYLPYLGTDTAAQGELSNSGLVVSKIFAPSYQRHKALAADRNTAICFSGFWQPGFSNASRSTKHTLLFVERFYTTSQGDIELRWRWTGTVHECALYSGGARIDGVTITSHRLGDVYAFVLYSGNDAGTLKTGLKIINMTQGFSCSLENSSVDLLYSSRLYVGSRSTVDHQCGGIIGGISVDSCAFSDATKIVDRIGNYEIADLFRRTAGRWYILQNNTTPHQFSRQTWRGSYPMLEERAI